MKILNTIQRVISLLCVGGILWAQDVPDPYRWLEDGNSPKVQAWVQDQNEKAEAYLKKIPADPALESRLHELYYVDSVSPPVQAGDRLFYKRTLAHQEQPAYFWKSRTNAAGGEYRWLDVAEVGDWVPSPNGNEVAYSLHTEGADEAILHVRNIKNGHDEPRDVIPGANFADVAWTPDSRGFYYMRLPVDASVSNAERVGLADLRYHTIGQTPAQDVLVYPPTHDASKYLTPQVSRDGHWLFVKVDQGWTSNAILYSNRQARDLQFKTLFASTAAVADVVAWKDRFYLHTNESAPHGKVLRKKPQEETWETIVPERQGITIESMHLVGGYLALVVLHNAAHDIEIYTLDGQKAWQIPIPDHGQVWDLSGREDLDDLYIEYESFFVPPCVYRAHLAKRKLEIWEQTKIALDASQFTSDLVWYPSKDGTPISMMIVHRKDLIRDGKASALLEGYGGFNTAILPRFSQEALVWLERGGVYAVPHLRGGGEYGEAWHQAGMLTRKQNTFDDFIAAAEYLVKEKYTQSYRLAIQGASNGGLLVTAVMTQRPDLFRVVVCKNPLTDMIRYPLFGEGKAWVPEYGSPDKPEEFQALLAYSPYHHIVKGIVSPSLLMLSGDHDDRVDPMHARKFIAALQAANTSPRPILFKRLQHSGHSASDRLDVQVQETMDRILFLENESSY